MKKLERSGRCPGWSNVDARNTRHQALNATNTKKRVPPHASTTSTPDHNTPNHIVPNFADMSDYEDDMDVDTPAVRDTVMFNSDNTNSKGKRSAANLPVEAEDSLPW